jgi:hypothetical protein
MSVGGSGHGAERIKAGREEKGIETCRFPPARGMIPYPTPMGKLASAVPAASASAVARRSIRIFDIILRVREKGNEIRVVPYRSTHEEVFHEGSSRVFGMQNN